MHATSTTPRLPHFTVPISGARIQHLVVRFTECRRWRYPRHCAPRVQLVEKLKDDDDDRLWRNYGRQGKGLTAKSMATILRPFGIRPDQMKVEGRKIRGYARAQFEKAWAAYVPNEDEGGRVADTGISGVRTGTTGTPLTDTGESPSTEPVPEGSAVPLRNDLDPLQDKESTGGTTSATENDGNETLTLPPDDDDGRDYEVF